jgi:hypothetical protein
MAEQTAAYCSEARVKASDEYDWSCLQAKKRSEVGETGPSSVKSKLSWLMEYRG